MFPKVFLIFCIAVYFECTIYIITAYNFYINTKIYYYFNFYTKKHDQQVLYLVNYVPYILFTECGHLTTVDSMKTNMDTKKDHEVCFTTPELTSDISLERELCPRAASAKPV